MALAFSRGCNGKAGPVYEEVNAKGEAAEAAYGAQPDADYVHDVASLQRVGLRQLWVPP